jgi:hypothetical protein
MIYISSASSVTDFLRHPPVKTSDIGVNGAVPSPHPDLVKKAVAQRIIAVKGTGKARCYHRHTILADTARCHALMLGIDHHGNAARLQNRMDTGSHLRGQRFLRLQAAGVTVQNAGQL